MQGPVDAAPASAARTRGGGPSVRAWFEPSPDHTAEPATFLQRNARFLVLAGLTVLCLAPFLGKAFNIDEPLFLWAAKHVQRHFFDPYGFVVNWYGSPLRMSEITKNPPILSYYLAVTALALGWSEVALHLALLPIAVVAILGTYLVARRYCQRPFVVALCVLFTPAFLVSSTTVMCDTMMLAFWVCAIHLWLTGLDQRAPLRLASASVLIALCALTKYFGLTLIPLLVLHSFATRRRPGAWLLYFLIPIALLAGYQYVTYRLYGRGLLLDAASFATTVKTQNRGWALRNLPVGLGFAGGGAAVILFFTRPLWSWMTVGAAALAGSALAVVISLTRAAGTHTLPATGGANWAISLQLALLAVGGVSLLALTVVDLLQRRSADSLFLCVWVLGTWFFAAFVNWTANARSILPLVPAVGILIVRRLERLGLPKPGSGCARLVPPLAAAALLSLLVAQADRDLAGSARSAAELAHARYGKTAPGLWFQGHWGFQYYMELGGGRPIDARRVELEPGSMVVVPTNNTNLFGLPNERVQQVYAIDVPSSRYVTTMLTRLGAGFFAEIWGPLPFAFGAVPPERYRFFLVVPPGRKP